MEIKVVVNIKPVETALNKLARSLQYRNGLMRAIAEDAHAAVMENFNAGGRPKWSATRRGGKVLVDSGRLQASIVTNYGNDHAEVGTNVEYAAIHQFGGKTKPHIIRAKRAKALKFGGRFAKSVKHPGSNIPARPFLSLTPQDKRDMINTVEDYLKKCLP